MRPRIELHRLLQRTARTKNVYFQPPENLRLSFPCIVYSQDRERPRYADNRKYANADRYTLTVIDKDPESPMRDAVRELPYCSFDRSFRAENMNHFVFIIYW